MDVIREFRGCLTQPHVRPWALAAPVLVLLFCLPLLRPIRHPLREQISDDELGRLATVQALVERHTLAIDKSSLRPGRGTVTVRSHLYSDQPPTMAVLLAGPYWLMHRFGLTFSRNPSMVEYLLTLLGVTIPVAMAAGLLYRMGRLFELARWKRAMLAVAVIFASGLISYATVLNAHALAASLIVAAAACLVHVAISTKPNVTLGWIGICGICAALAAAIEPTAVIFTILLAAVIPALRWRPSMRVAAILVYLLGLAPALLLHAHLTVPITGDIRPVAWHPELLARAGNAGSLDALDDEDGSRTAAVWQSLARFNDSAFGEHGALSHFPVIILGMLGIAAVMHRHWPITTKILAGATGVAAGAIVIACCVNSAFDAGRMFAARWFIVFLPLLVFWAGAWVRRRHHPITWSLAALMLLFSAGVSMVGSTDPLPRDGYARYSAAEALARLTQPEPLPRPTILAGR